MRAFRLLGNSELGHARALADAAIQAWAKVWLSGSSPVLQLRAADGDAISGGAWRALVTDGYVGVQCDTAALAQALYGTAQRQKPSALAREAALATVDDLLARLARASSSAHQATAGPVTHDAPAAAAWARGGGALLLEIAIEDLTLHAVLDAAATARCLATLPRPARTPPALQPLATCIGKGRLSMVASVGETEIDIATLHSLAVGDVLPLDLRIDRPLRLRIDGRLTPRGAYLGSHNGCRAVLVTATHDSPESTRHVR